MDTALAEWYHLHPQDKAPDARVQSAMRTRAIQLPRSDAHRKLSQRRGFTTDPPEVKRVLVCWRYGC